MVLRDTINSNPFWGGPHIMGVVNVTPDSFSDGGKFINIDNAVAHGVKLVQQGAHILDIGGESTRPGAERVDVKEEIARVVPVIVALRKELGDKAPWISIDSRNAKTMEAAIEAGATAINDVSALSYDSRSINVATQAQVPIFLMHAQGLPQDMQDNPIYNNVLEDIFEYLKMRISYCETHRIDASLLIVDPGIGFGKTLEHNCIIIRNIKKFRDLGVPVLLGASRKSFIADICEGEPPGERIPGSLATALYGYSQGVNIFRVHDVAETVQALKVFDAISTVQTATNEPAV